MFLLQYSDNMRKNTIVDEFFHFEALISSGNCLVYVVLIHVNSFQMASKLKTHEVTFRARQLSVFNFLIRPREYSN
jgi:hypothetical protein